MPASRSPRSRRAATSTCSGYFIDPAMSAAPAFLTAQRHDRMRRVHEMAERLAALGRAPSTPTRSDRRRATGRSVGRPQVAPRCVAAGHVRHENEAFDRFLGTAGRRSFRGVVAPPDEVVAHHRDGAGGVASLAHPGLAGWTDHPAARRTPACRRRGAAHRSRCRDRGAISRARGDARARGHPAAPTFTTTRRRRAAASGQIALTAEEFAGAEASDARP